MEWLLILGGLGLAHYVNKQIPEPPPRATVRTIHSIRKAFSNNLAMIDRLPLSAEEREAAREAARQKMLRDLDDLMS